MLPVGTAHPATATHPAPTYAPSPTPATRPSDLNNVLHIGTADRPKCSYTDGKFVGNLTWVPAPSEGCYYMQYTKEMAFKCLEGTQVVLYGNSNVRALYSALEGILKARATTPRLEAKQTCENNRKNHSCGMEVSYSHNYDNATTNPPIQKATYRNVSLYYWGWVNGAFSDKLPNLFEFQKNPSMVIGNTGVNVIQRTKHWSGELAGQLPGYNRWITKGFGKGTKLVWMSTTRICEAQPHYKRYAYKKSYWLHRPLDKMNAEIRKYNAQHIQALDPSIALLDAATMCGSPSLCPFNDDPLHHKAADKHIANVLLNMYCNKPI